MGLCLERCRELLHTRRPRERIDWEVALVGRSEMHWTFMDLPSSFSDQVPLNKRLAKLLK